MQKIIPLLPATNIIEGQGFYEALGFQQTYFQKAPYPYFGVSLGELELNFHQCKTLEANQNYMNYIQVDKVDDVYEQFEKGIKSLLGKVPRSGRPMLSKPRSLSEDRRFSFVDPSGNYFYVGTPISENPARTLESKVFAKHFALLYDLFYSKEDLKAAQLTLDKFFPKDLLAMEVSDTDLSKILAVALEIEKQVASTETPAYRERLNQLHNENTI
ncbi:MAG: hypothetical protein FWF59_00655 [Turicibacter sp.]|nr:hypothetical protein [Turicibacter sp.]